MRCVHQDFGMQVLEAMTGGGSRRPVRPEGFRHQAERPAWRGGNVASQVTLGGRQVAVPRLRVRRADGEAPLSAASNGCLSATDPLDEHTLAAVAAGVSTSAVCGHVGPGAGRGGGAGNVEQRRCLERFVALSCQAPAVVDSARRGWASVDLRVQSASTARSSGTMCMVVALGITYRSQGCKLRAGTARRSHRDCGRRPAMSCHMPTW